MKRSSRREENERIEDRRRKKRAELKRRK